MQIRWAAAMAVLWSAVGLLSLWKLPPAAENLWLLPLLELQAATGFIRRWY